MSTKDRKERKRAGAPFERKAKVPTGTYVPKREAQKARRKALNDLADLHNELVVRARAARKLGEN